MEFQPLFIFTLQCCKLFLFVSMSFSKVGHEFLYLERFCCIFPLSLYIFFWPASKRMIGVKIDPRPSDFSRSNVTICSDR